MAWPGRAHLRRTELDNSPETFENMKPYIFRRAEVWYVVELRHDEDAMNCVPINPGTIGIDAIEHDGSLRNVFTLQ